MVHRRIVVVFGLSGWTKTGDKIKMHCHSRSEAVMDILMTTILSGLGFLISICDLNGASLFADGLFWWNCYLLWWTFLPVKPLFAYLGSLLIPMTFALRGVKDLYNYLAGNWLVCIGRARL